MNYNDNRRLKTVTFTGIDGKTDINTLAEIQRKYPKVEFGVLISKNWKDNGTRYFNPDMLLRLMNNKLELSCHLCGRIAREAIRGNWNPAIELINPFFGIFRRCQLNIATSDKNPESLADFNIPDSLSEVIIQQHSAQETQLYMTAPRRPYITTLIDGSGGLGIDTGINVLPYGGKVGYAGGFNIDNVVDKTRQLLESPQVSEFWIDMESSVRTDDIFDCDKVIKVCEALDEAFPDILYTNVAPYN